MTFQPNYKIGTVSGTLQTLEGVTPPGDYRAFRPFSVYGRYLPGEYKTRLDGNAYFAGFPQQKWSFTQVTWLQHKYLQDQYCNGGYSGTVFMTTRIDNPNVYGTYSAVLTIPRELNPNFQAFDRYEMLFTRLVEV